MQRPGSERAEAEGRMRLVTTGSQARVERRWSYTGRQANAVMQVSKQQMRRHDQALQAFPERAKAAPSCSGRANNSSSSQR